MSQLPGSSVPGPWVKPPEHPQAMTVLIIGVVGVGVAGIASPVAWYLASKALKEIDAEPGRWSGREQVRTGQILGMVGTGLLILSICCLALWLPLELMAAVEEG